MHILIETIGWISTGLFLVSILIPQRVHLHTLGVGASITTGIYAYAHGATAIWVKWLIAFFFHSYMCLLVPNQQMKNSLFHRGKVAVAAGAATEESLSSIKKL